MKSPDSPLYKSLDFFASQTVEGFITGMHKSPYQGFSVEFAEHRVYNPGDSIRHIDWKLYARTDHLYVKRYDEETNLRAHLILDTSRSMYFPPTGETKLSFGIKAIAVLCQLLKRQRDAFALTTFSDRIHSQTPVRSSEGHYQEMLLFLQQLMDSPPSPEKEETRLVKMIHIMAEKIQRRSLVILFSDLFDSLSDPNAFFDAINHLKFKKHEIIVFHTLASREETLFEYESGPYMFVDPESGESFKVHTEDVREAYLEKIQAFNHLVKEKCLQYKLDLIPADIYQGFNQIMIPFLLKRQKLI
jgi:hypothetical protein